jgi:N-acetylneuraminic acid mutarotase
MEEPVYDLKYNKASSQILDTEELNKSYNKYTALTRNDFDMTIIDNWCEIKAKNIPKRRCNHLSFIHNDILYLIGGRDINKGKIQENHYLFLNNITTNNEIRWEALISHGVIPEGLSNSAGDLAEDTFYMFGGENKDSKSTNDLYIYKINDDKWEKRIFVEREIPAMIGHSFSYYQAGEIFILFGGFHSGKYSNELYTYDKSHWKKVGMDNPLPGRVYHTVTVVGSCLYIFGGETADGVYLNDLWKYDIIANTWDEIKVQGEVPKPRTGHSCVVYKNCLYYFGGKISSIQERNELWRYNINKNTFELLHDTLIENRTFDTLDNLKKSK